MSELPENQKEEHALSPNEKVAETETRPADQEAAIYSTISAYFEAERLSAPAFLKSLKAAKVTRFESADESRALELMGENDPHGDRLWTLLSLSTLPKCLDRWIWKATQDRLKVVVGDRFDIQSESSTHILRELRNFLVPLLDSDDKSAAHGARNWLRIGICWLVEKRSLDPWLVADLLKPIVYRQPSDAANAARKAMQRGKWSDLRLAVGVASLAGSLVEDARKERDSERESVFSLRLKLSSSERDVERLRAEMASLQKELAHKTDEVTATKAALEAEKHHRGHDLSESKTEHRALLRDRIAPLLSDAVDALEIEPSEPRIALNRLKRVVSIIDEVKS